MLRITLEDDNYIVNITDKTEDTEHITSVYELCRLAVSALGYTGGTVEEYFPII